MSIRNKIKQIATIENGLTLEEVTDKLIEEIIKPLCKDAFEAGGNFAHSPYAKPDFEQWIKENLK